METRVASKTFVLIALAGLLAAIGAIPSFAQEGGPCPLQGIWINTSYNGQPTPAVLVWTRQGTLTAYNESWDTRCSGDCRGTVADSWNAGGGSYLQVTQVTPFLGGVELRAAHVLYRVSSGWNVMEIIQASWTLMDRSAASSTDDSVYRIFYRQRPAGLEPGPANAGPSFGS